MEAEKIKIPDIFSKELVVFLFIIEEIEKNNIVTYRDIIDYTCWVRHTVERIVTNLIDMNFIELSAFENEHIAFMLTRFGINLELIDTDKKAKRIIK